MTEEKTNGGGEGGVALTPHQRIQELISGMGGDMKKAGAAQKRQLVEELVSLQAPILTGFFFFSLSFFFIYFSFSFIFFFFLFSFFFFFL